MKQNVKAAGNIDKPNENRSEPTLIASVKATGGSWNRGGGGNNGNDNDNRIPENYPDYPVEEFHPNKYRIIMWFLLLVVLMTFGALVSAYVVIATNGVVEWQPFSLPYQVWISTALIIASSLTYQVANKKLQQNKQIEAKNWLLATTALGGIFISSQILLWLALVNRGYYLQGNPYVGFFYILTVAHAVHVAIGIATLGYLTLLTGKETNSDNELLRRQTLANVVGWYWHFMDGLWIVLIFLLGFWK